MPLENKTPREMEDRQDHIPPSPHIYLPQNSLLQQDHLQLFFFSPRFPGFFPGFPWDYCCHD